MSSETKSEPGSTQRDLGSLLARWGMLLGAVTLFIFGVELLQASAHHLESFLQTHLQDVVNGRMSAIGASWLGAYVTLSGSVIAAIALALFDSAALTSDQLAMMIYGSRFGGAGMILLVGLLDVIKDESIELERGSTIGLLTFMLTLGVGIPSLFIGIGVLGLDLGILSVSSPDILSPASEAGGGIFAAIISSVIDLVTPAVSFVLGAAVLLGGLKLLHRTLRAFDVERLADRANTIFRNRWTSFGLGLGLTIIATSVAVSVGAIVPLYNRGVLDRDQLIPYIMGANIGTFGDTILIAWLMERPDGFGLSLLVVATMLVTTVVVLLAYGPFRGVINQLERIMLRTKRRVITTMAILAALPAALMVTGLI